MKTATVSCHRPGEDVDLKVQLTESEIGTVLTIDKYPEGYVRSAPFDDVLAEYRRAGWAVES